MYVRGLLGPGERKSVQPLVARVVPADYEPDDYAQVHHSFCANCWDPAPLEHVLAAKARATVGGRDAMLIVDDTALLKRGPLTARV